MTKRRNNANLDPRVKATYSKRTSSEYKNNAVSDASTRHLSVLLNQSTLTLTQQTFTSRILDLNKEPLSIEELTADFHGTRYIHMQQTSHFSNKNDANKLPFSSRSLVYHIVAQIIDLQFILQLSRHNLETQVTIYQEAIKKIISHLQFIYYATNDNLKFLEEEYNQVKEHLKHNNNKENYISSLPIETLRKNFDIFFSTLPLEDKKYWAFIESLLTEMTIFNNKNFSPAYKIKKDNWMVYYLINSATHASEELYYHFHKNPNQKFLKPFFISQNQLAQDLKKFLIYKTPYWNYLDLKEVKKTIEETTNDYILDLEKLATKTTVSFNKKNSSAQLVASFVFFIGAFHLYEDPNIAALFLATLVFILALNQLLKYFDLCTADKYCQISSLDRHAKIDRNAWTKEKWIDFCAQPEKTLEELPSKLLRLNPQLRIHLAEHELLVSASDNTLFSAATKNKLTYTNSVDNSTQSYLNQASTLYKTIYKKKLANKIEKNDASNLNDNAPNLNIIANDNIFSTKPSPSTRDIADKEITLKLSINNAVRTFTIKGIDTLNSRDKEILVNAINNPAGERFAHKESQSGVKLNTGKGYYSFRIKGTENREFIFNQTGKNEYETQVVDGELPRKNSPANTQLKNQAPRRSDHNSLWNSKNNNNNNKNNNNNNNNNNFNIIYRKP